MNIVSGCDIGSLTSKAVILKNNRIIGSARIKSIANPVESANIVIKKALDIAGLNKNDISYCVGTGYGRELIEGVSDTMTEIACHAKGAKWLLPSVKTVIDIGGQDCKVIKIDQNGNVIKFLTNDKCASGTGRFLEVMAKLLDLKLDDIGKMSKKASSPIIFASTCTVWAQADVIKHINDGRQVPDIAAGINNAMANRVAMLVRSISPVKDIAMTGGVAKNDGVVNAIEKMIGMKIKKIKKADPQLAGAIGAALFADSMQK